MNRKILLVICIIIISIIFIFLFNSKEVTNNIENNNNSNISNLNNTDFNLAFLKLENNSKNIIYSPLSIKYALCMLREGANGNSKSQINNVIGTDKVSKYENIDKNLSFANGLFIRDTYFENVKQNYIDVLENEYNAEIKEDVFENANNVNKWIEDKTLGIIKNMLKDSLVQKPDLKMLLINALAIDMDWDSKFECEDTTGDDFYTKSGEKIEATTMHKETKNDDVSYYLDKDITAISMDLKKYNDTQLEFIAIMPKNKTISEYIENSEMSDINKIINGMKKASTADGGIYISIPKFKYDYDLNLKSDLISLGIKDVFDGELADLNGIFDVSKTGKNLYVSDAFHKADIEFSEDGIKAAAVTIFAMMENAAIIEKEQPIDVKINKPFIFIVRDKNTNENWFIGNVETPNLWENDENKYQEAFEKNFEY